MLKIFRLETINILNMDLGTFLTLLFLILIFIISIIIYFRNLKWFLDKETEIKKLIQKELTEKNGYILNIYKPNSNDNNPISKNETESETFFIESIEATYFRIILFRKENKKFESWAKIETGIFTKPKIIFSDFMLKE